MLLMNWSIEICLYGKLKAGILSALYMSFWTGWNSVSSNNNSGILSAALCSLDLWFAKPFLVLQHGMMMSYLMFSWCLSRPGNLATEVAGMRDASDVVSLDVSPHIPRWCLLSANIARSHKSIAIGGPNFGYRHHSSDLRIEILKICTILFFWHSYCCVKI